MISSDLFLIIFLVLGLLLGLIRGWWRCLIGILVLLSVCGILYFGFFDYASNWIQYDLLAFLQEKGVIPTGFEISELGLTLRITNVHDTFLLLQNVGLDPILLSATSEGFSKGILALVGFIVVLPISLILSSLLYWVLLRWIMPRRVRSGVIARLLGGVLGIIEGAGVCMVILSFSGNVVTPIDNVVIPYLEDSSSDLYQAIVSLGVNASDISNLLPTVKNVTALLNPLSESSKLVRPLFEQLNNIGLSPFNLITVNVIDETGAKVPISAKDAFTDMLDDLVTVGAQKINTLIGA